MDKPNETKIRRFPGTHPSPRTILAEALESPGEHDGIAIVFKNSDGSFSCDWSLVELRDLAMMAACLTVEAHREIVANDDAIRGESDE